MATLDSTIRKTHDWALDRINLMSESVDSIEDGYSICQEFKEWLDTDSDSHEVCSLAYIGKGSEYQ
tara:strand:- start:505 stop:702 length:198 start_codon:yes stop_codon:yes gene_type:complete